MIIVFLKYIIFIVTLLVPCSTAVVQQQPIQFSFSNDPCHNGTFYNTGNTDFDPPLWIRRNEQTTKCSPGMGVEARSDINHPVNNNTTEVANDNYHLQTSQPLINLLQQQGSSNNNDAITISLWVQVTQPDMEISTGPLLTIGTTVASNNNNNDDNEYYYLTTECDQKQVDLALSISNTNFVDLLYRTSDPYFEPCVRMRVNELPLSAGLNHIAVVLGDRHQQVFVNGRPSTSRSDPFDPKLHHWNDQSGLYLFSFPTFHLRQAWTGQILQLSMDTTKLLWSAPDVVAEMAKGLPDAKPIAKSMVHQMKEDAQVPLEEDVDDEVGNNTTAFLQAPVDYMNHDVISLLEPFNMTQETLSLLLQDLKYYIVQYPSRGTLYQIVGMDDGPSSKQVLQKIEMVQDVPAAIQGPDLFYLPPHNEHSEMPGSIYDSFQYCVVSQKQSIFASSQCSSMSIGTIDIVVDAVNDPPTALIILDESAKQQQQQQPYLVHEGIHEETKGLWLGGHDVDRNDGISKIQITKPPQFGFLYLSVPTPRQDGLIHGTRLSDWNDNNTIVGPKIFVEYRYTGGHQTLQSTMAHDSFWFRVQDRNDAWSKDVQAEIRILPSLSIGTPKQFYAMEQEPLVVPISGHDESGLDRPIGYFFETLPSEESFGTLFLDGRSKPLKRNLVIVPTSTTPEESSSGGLLNLTFRSSGKVCADPMVSTVNATFAYRVVAISSSNAVASVSSLVEHTIQVKCVIEPLRLSILDNNEGYNIETFSGPLDDPCSGYVYNATNTTNPASCSSAAIISSIQVEASKRQDERVLVSMEASPKGFLTLNRNQRSKISAIGGPVEMRQRIQFLAFPSELQEILSNLHYQTETPGRHKIQIKVQSCSTGENPMEIATDVPNNCEVSTAFISINAVQPHAQTPEKLYTSFPWFSLSFTLTMLFLFKSKGKMRETLEDWKEGDPAADGVYQWKEHLDASTGYYYYENVENGQVTWRAPLHESILPAPERFPDGSSNPIYNNLSNDDEEDGSLASDSLRSVSLTEGCDSDDEYSLEDVSLHSISSIA